MDAGWRRKVLFPMRLTVNSMRLLRPRIIQNHSYICVAKLVFSSSSRFFFACHLGRLVGKHIPAHAKQMRQIKCAYLLTNCSKYWSSLFGRYQSNIKFFLHLPQPTCSCSPFFFNARPISIFPVVFAVEINYSPIWILTYNFDKYTIFKS